MSAGYSGKTLIEKLGLKAGHHARFVQPPGHYAALLGPLPPGVTYADAAATDCDFIHLFATARAGLERIFPLLRAQLAPRGMLWVSWPKKAARIATDLDEHVVRAVGLANGLVDVKVCAVDAAWSGLKFVRRVTDRG